MKKRVFAAMACLALLACLCACGSKAGSMAGADYTADAAIGQGDTQFTAQVTVGEESVTFTVSTDEETLGGALLEAGLISGEEGPYGLYVTAVNGVTADYDADGAYWAFYQDGEYLMQAADATPLTPGGHYEIVYSR